MLEWANYCVGLPAHRCTFIVPILSSLYTKFQKHPLPSQCNNPRFH